MTRVVSLAMNEVGVWELIKLGKFADACARADVEFHENGDIFPLRNKVFALLHLEEFDGAIRLSRQIMATSAESADSDFIFLGAAWWCKGQTDSAVEAWRAGLTAKYTDAAGGAEVPMLLFFAAVRTKNKGLEKEAICLLKKLRKSKRISNWPGPIARYLLDLVSEEELRFSIDPQPILREKQSCQADFYAAVKRLAVGDEEGWREKLRACVDHGLVCSAKVELHLAKGELANVSS